jgi:acyl-CoA synthetase (AMP-forming)/AMP-acid ligase II
VALVHEAELAGRLPAAGRVPALAHRFAVGGDAAGAAPFAALLAAAPLAAAPVPPPPSAGEEATGIILYTSGTTGRPKGAMLTHLNIVHSCLHYRACFGLGPDDRSALVVPASHVTGLIGLIFALLAAGGCLVLLDRFDAAGFLAVAARERVTHTIMVPAMYNLCLLRAEFDPAALAAWRIGAYGGAPMPEATIARLAEALPNLTLVNAYGATETTSPTTLMPFGATAARPDSIGLVVPCGEVRIMDPQGREVPAGEPGEIWIAGPMVVPGYWNRPEATAREFAAGFWRSGDLGSMDTDGFLRIHDRIKDMINRGGYKVFSAELENVLAHHPKVAEVAAVARPDPVLGERVQVFVVARGAAPPTLEELRAFAAGHLADYKLPDGLTLVADTLPRNANGKVLKRDLAARLAAAGVA